MYSPYSLNLRATTRDTRRVRRLNSRTRQPLKLVLAHRRQRILRAPAHGCPLISTHRPRRRRHRAFDRTDLRFHARTISRASRTRAYNPRNTNASGAKLHQTPMRDSCVARVVVAARAVQTCAKCMRVMRCDATRGWNLVARGVRTVSFVDDAEREFERFEVTEHSTILWVYSIRHAPTVMDIETHPCRCGCAEFTIIRILGHSTRTITWICHV